MDGHRALGQLCAQGRVRVLLTTNFDRLLERALDEAGVAAQVIATLDEIDGMTPLAHAAATVIKLHGDYAATMRNTPKELGEYPAKLRGLLARVFDEYGLLIVGWSAEYDIALTNAISACPSRRYPTYWASYRGALTETARRLIAQRQAILVDTAGADELFVDLTERIARLDQRAIRRGRPTPLRTYAFPPEQGSVPQGWSFLPLLQLRAVAGVGPASIDTCGVIRPQDRDAVVNALRGAAVTARLYGLGSALVASATVTEGSDSVRRAAPLTAWSPTPGGHQSTEYASYRLGGDASFGVSALVTVRLPGVGAYGGWIVFTIDIGLSLAAAIRLGEAAMLWRDGLILTSALLPEALTDILPAEADVVQGEAHVLAAPTNGHSANHPNELGERLDLSPLGSATRTVGPSMGFAMRLAGALSEREAADVVAEAIQLYWRSRTGTSTHGSAFRRCAGNSASLRRRVSSGGFCGSKHNAQLARRGARQP